MKHKKKEAKFLKINQKNMTYYQIMLVRIKKAHKLHK